MTSPFSPVQGRALGVWASEESPATCFLAYVFYAYVLVYVLVYVFRSVIVRQSKVVRWVYERAKNHRLRVSGGNDGSQYHQLLEILKDTLLSN